MEKEFVKYELAVELVKLGFNEPCFCIYNREKKLRFNNLHNPQDRNKSAKLTFNNGKIPVPLYQQAFKFVRQKYDLCYSIDPFDDNTYDYTVFNPNITEVEEFDEGPYDTYEEAELACLTRLIIIAKGLDK